MVVTIATATIGRPDLLRTLRSVASQTEQNYQHLLIVDGQEHKGKVETILRVFADEHDLSKISTVVLPYNLGGYGGPAYSLAPTLAKGEYICNLDDDDWIEPNHLSSLLNALSYYHRWSYCLNNIAVEDTIVCQDNCCALGYIHPIWKYPTEYHIGTGGMLLPKYIAKELASYWEGDNSPAILNDRMFYSVLKTKYPNYVCTMEYTFNYTTSYGGKNDTNFYLMGNKYMKETYGKEKHWIY